MFHSHNIMSKSRSSTSLSSDHKEELYQDVFLEPSRESLLSVLDDKNKAIATLQKQLMNQKAQLTYYLQKELASPKITQLSESCSPEISQENMAVNLAMSKFNKKMGIKSNILSLYERMCFIDENITGSLQDQEFLLRKIVNKLCEFVKHANSKIEFRVQFSNFISDPFHIELFNKLLNATINLRKKLDTFRICCNRLMIIEDERNAIVEQIYTLPTEQRLNCNFLISMQTEKIHLENELQQILKVQRKDQERIKELSAIERKLSNLQHQLRSSIFRNDDSCRINKMLQKVHSEAKLLLDLTKGQRKKFENEILRVRRQKNLTLERVLIYIKMAMENMEMEEKTVINENSISSKEEIKIYECIKKEIDNAKDKFKCKMFDELQAKRKECEIVKNRLNLVMLERNELTFQNTQLQRGISDMKFNQNLDLSTLKEERDTYKSQVEDLEAIREAYAQLVERQPATTATEKEYFHKIREKDKKIDELEKFNSYLRKEVRTMKHLISRQNKELKQQREILGSLKENADSINEFGDNNNKLIKYVYKNSNAMEDFTKDKVYSDNLDKCAVSYIELYEQEIFVEEQIVKWVGKDGVCILPFTGKNQLEHNLIKVDDKIVDSNQVSGVSENSLKLKKQKEREEKERGSENITSFTQLQVPSNNIEEEQPTDVLEATVKTNMDAELEASQKLEKSSDFFLDINYKPKAKGSEEVDKEKRIVDDYELMKDCSDESVAVVCEPVRKSKETCFSMDSPINSCIFRNNAMKIETIEGGLTKVDDNVSVSSGEGENNFKYKLALNK